MDVSKVPNVLSTKHIRHTRGSYVDKDGFTANNIENFFGVFKHPTKAHIHCDQQHLQRYVSENTFAIQTARSPTLNAPKKR